jgi:hypothetical protein
LRIEHLVHVDDRETRLAKCRRRERLVRSSWIVWERRRIAHIEPANLAPACHRYERIDLACQIASAARIGPQFDHDQIGIEAADMLLENRTPALSLISLDRPAGARIDAYLPTGLSQAALDLRR